MTAENHEMNAKDVISLIRKGESESLEFKRNFEKSAVETITAFANTTGGIILIGVEDNGEITGRVVGKETTQNWINQVKQATTPSVIPDIEIIDVDEKQVAAMRVTEFPIKPVAFKGRYFKRLKNSNHHMNISEVTQLHLKTFSTSWDYYIDDNHNVDHISLEKVARFIELANKYRDNKITDDPLRVLNKFELMRDNKITYGGFLLFMEGHSALSTIELARFQTPTIIKDSTTLKSDLIQEVEAAMDFVKKHLNKAYLFDGSIQREERWDYPLEAVREIIVNAIVHRDYRDASDSVIKIYDSYIQFFNPGKLPDGLTVEVLLSGDYVSTIRNKKVAEIFKEAGIIEKYGSGIGKIREAIKNHGLPEPVFEERGSGFMVTVLKNSSQKDTMRDTMGDAMEPVKSGQKGSMEAVSKDTINNSAGGGISGALGAGEKDVRIIVEIEKNPVITAEGLSKLLGINLRNTKTYLSKLKEQGRIKRVGGKRYGRWQACREI
ncbi:MAG: winged helix-turn-helix transcriptional regulator [bacterium]|nr:winged helix-turn-helix transcriptional regulator [bacterium]